MLERHGPVAGPGAEKSHIVYTQEAEEPGNMARLSTFKAPSTLWHTSSSKAILPEGSITSTKGTPNWWSSVQTHEPVGDSSHPNCMGLGTHLITEHFSSMGEAWIQSLSLSPAFSPSLLLSLILPIYNHTESLLAEPHHQPLRCFQKFYK